MRSTRLNDAAIALHRALAAAHIKHGIFGGFAVATLGGPREGKDIDCLAAVNKEQVLDILNSKHGFTFIDRPGNDFVAFLWTENPHKKYDPVLVEVLWSNSRVSDEAQTPGRNRS